MSEVILETKGLTRYFGKTPAVCDLSLKLQKGEVYALLGQNGAGKSTLLKMILGMLEPTRGSASIFGEDSQHLTPETRARIAYLTEGHPLYGWMKIKQIAKFTKNTHPRWSGTQFDHFLEYFALDPNKRIQVLSNGQRAQVALSIALACEPELLIMDDPTLGVDPGTRKDLLMGIVDLVSNEGRTVLFTTHILADVERVASHIGILEQSVLRVNCSLEEFKEQVVRYHLFFEQEVPPKIELPRQISQRIIGREVLTTIVRPDEETEKGIRALGAREFKKEEMSLEEAFIEYTTGRTRQIPFSRVLSH